MTLFSLDILKENWSAVYNIHTILLSIQSLLSEPNPDSPLNQHAASLWAIPVCSCWSFPSFYQSILIFFSV